MLVALISEIFSRKEEMTSEVRTVPLKTKKNNKVTIKFHLKDFAKLKLDVNAIPGCCFGIYKLNGNAKFNQKLKGEKKIVQTP